MARISTRMRSIVHPEERRNKLVQLQALFAEQHAQMKIAYSMSESDLSAFLAQLVREFDRDE